MPSVFVYILQCPKFVCRGAIQVSFNVVSLAVSDNTSFWIYVVVSLIIKVTIKYNLKFNKKCYFMVYVSCDVLSNPARKISGVWEYLSYEEHYCESGLWHTAITLNQSSNIT